MRVPKWFITLSLWINKITPIHFMLCATLYAGFLYALELEHPALAFFFTMVLVLGVVAVIKLATKVRRPDDCLVELEHNDRAFPSGHVASAAFVATMVTHTFPHLSTVEQYLLGALLFVLAVVVALSRLALRAHTVTQVFVGFLIGILIPLTVITVVDPPITQQILNML